MTLPREGVIREGRCQKGGLSQRGVTLLRDRIRSVSERQSLIERGLS